DFTIAVGGGDITGVKLSGLLVTNSILISTLPGAINSTNSFTSTTVGNGDINVNDAVAWTTSGTPTTLTLDALHDVNINAAVTATGGNFVVCCGHDININAAITTTR